MSSDVGTWRDQPRLDYRRHALAGMLLLVVLFGGSLAWASYATISSAVIATGVVVVQGKPKSVQHLDGGIVEAIHVKAGDRVVADQILVRLDDTTLAANLAIYERRLRDAIVLRERLGAELDGRPEFEPPLELARLLKLGDLSVSVAQQVSLMDARRLTRESQLAQLDEKIVQVEHQISGIDGMRGEKEKQVAAYAEEIEVVEGLLKEQLTTNTRYLALMRAQAELRGQIAEQVGEAAKLATAITETRIAKLQLVREFRERVAAEIEKADAQIDELRQQTETTRKQLARVLIRAPVSGIVHELNLFTVGGVVAPGQTLMQVIPQHGKHEIELSIETTAIDQIEVGQRVIVRLPAFHQRTTPELDGHVLAVSPSSVVDEKTGAAFYRVAIDIPEGELARLDGKKLVPGMPVEANIPIADRTVMSYLVKPLFDNLSRALREE
ncbi:MAG: HlyD family type I secretion periplasmic adaptor subunit [Hyphomicrobium sp.]